MSWSDIFLPSGAQTAAEQEANYARQQQEFQDRLARREAEGSLSPEQTRYYTANTEDQLWVQDTAAWEGFREGAIAGLNNVLDAPGKVVDVAGQGLTQVIWGILKAIPWWAWLAAAGALFLWMGGLSLLRGRLAR